MGTYLTRDGIVGVLETARGSVWAPLAYVAIYTIATALALPGSILTIAGGAVFGFWGGSLLTTIGANLGASAAFGLSRMLGREGVERFAGRRLKGIDSATEQHGFLGLLVLRLIPLVPFNALNFGSGLTAIKWRDYILATLIGIVPGTLVYTFFADALVQGSTQAGAAARTRLWIAAALFLLLSVVPLVARKLGMRSPARSPRGSGVASRASVMAFLMLTAAAPFAAQGLPDHTQFDSVLVRHLHGVYVDYAGLKADPQDLYSYLDALDGTNPQVLADAPGAAQLAFWINAYNACAIKLVLDNYPIRKASFPQSVVNSVAGVPGNSIRQISDTWKREFCSVAGDVRSLDEIEHEIIRPMGDPRIHFAVNCASKSCPVLAEVSYTAESLDQQLDAAVHRFVSDTNQYRLVRGDPPKLRVNKILDWYKDDFGGEDGVVEFLARYVSNDDGAYIRDHGGIDLEYNEYDWTLNDTAVFPDRQ
jgi:uncharacterized membrane protein YdjX (TVP38/TMEM64 family)